MAAPICTPILRRGFVPGTDTVLHELRVRIDGPEPVEYALLVEGEVTAHDWAVAFRTMASKLDGQAP